MGDSNVGPVCIHLCSAYARHQLTLPRCIHFEDGLTTQFIVIHSDASVATDGTQLCFALVILVFFRNRMDNWLFS